MDVKPDLPTIGLGEIEDLLVRSQRPDPRRSFDVEGICNWLLILEIADDQDDGWILRPDRRGDPFKLRRIDFIDGFFITKFEMPQSIRLLSAVLDTFPAPFTFR